MTFLGLQRLKKKLENWGARYRCLTPKDFDRLIPSWIMTRWGTWGSLHLLPSQIVLQQEQECPLWPHRNKTAHRLNSLHLKSRCLCHNWFETFLLTSSGFTISSVFFLDFATTSSTETGLNFSIQKNTWLFCILVLEMWSVMQISPVWRNLNPFQTWQNLAWRCVLENRISVQMVPQSIHPFRKVTVSFVLHCFAWPDIYFGWQVSFSCLSTVSVWLPLHLESKCVKENWMTRVR